MLDEDVSYSKESVIDRAFPFIDELDNQINTLKLQLEEVRNKDNNLNFFKKLFNKKNINEEFDDSIKIKRNYCKMHKFRKDGYDFVLRSTRVYKENDPTTPYYYEFFVNIKYNFETKNKQFYKRFACENESKKYFEDMEGVFKHLTRRDLIERLFIIKQKEINSLKDLINR